MQIPTSSKIQKGSMLPQRQGRSNYHLIVHTLNFDAVLHFTSFNSLKTYGVFEVLNLLFLQDHT